MANVWIVLHERHDGYAFVVGAADSELLAKQVAELNNDGIALMWNEDNDAKGDRGDYGVRELTVLSSGPKYQLHNGIQGAR